MRCRTADDSGEEVGEVSYHRKEIIGNCTLYLGDCREVLPTLGTVDAVVSDPPYGQKLNTNITGASVGGRKPGSGRGYRVPAAGNLRSPPKAAVIWPKSIHGDDKPFDPGHLLAVSKTVLLWGAHKFGHTLPRGRWLGWDKVPTGKVRDQGDGELAWTNDNPDGAFRLFRLLWDGVCVDSAARDEVTAGQQRVHPTQKPVVLMSWCLRQIAIPARGLVCDPYMGGGSTGVAAVKAGHRFIGMEIEELYFETACRRIEEAYRQPDMFVAPTHIKPVQGGFDL